MSQQEKLGIIHEAFEAWNAHDVDRYAALLNEGYIEETHSWPAPVRGLDAARAAMQEYFNVFPDLNFDIDVMIISGDQVFTRWVATGTYRGELMNPLPPDRRIEVYGCTLSKLGEGKVMHSWHYWETDQLLRHVSAQRGQDGALPVHRVPAAPGAA